MVLKRPAINRVGVVVLRILGAIPRYAWATAGQIAEGIEKNREAGAPVFDHQTVAGAIRAKLFPRYVKRRSDPDVRKGVHRWQYKRLTV